MVAAETGAQTERTFTKRQEVQLFSFFEELAEPIKNVALTAYRSRGKLAQDAKAYVYFVSGTVYSMPVRAIKVVKNPKLHELIADEEDPEALAAVAVGGSAALCLGSAGAVVGSTVGGAAGTVIGIVPAIFTFGLSIPVGGSVGLVSGLSMGAAVGGTAGFVGGAATGYGVALYRSEIRNVVICVSIKVQDLHNTLIYQPRVKVKKTAKYIGDKVKDSAEYTDAKVRNLGLNVKELACDKRFQITVASAGTGAAVLGTAGAAGGTMIGGATGALIGLVPAVFTFGLSIPIGAVVGGGFGCAAGATAGGTAGFVSGGTAGFAGSTFGAPAYRSIKNKAMLALSSSGGTSED